VAILLTLGCVCRAPIEFTNIESNRGYKFESNNDFVCSIRQIPMVSLLFFMLNRSQLFISLFIAGGYDSDMHPRVPTLDTPILMVICGRLPLSTVPYQPVPSVCLFPASLFMIFFFDAIEEIYILRLPYQFKKSRLP
jgi:hypothetical protein